MRKKNRKKNSGGGLAFPAPFAMVIAIASVLCICYLFLGARCMAIGEEIKVLEAQQQELNKIRMNEDYKWSQSKSPRNLLAALQKHELQMDWPRRSQIVYVDDNAMYEANVAAVQNRGQEAGSYR